MLTRTQLERDELTQSVRIAESESDQLKQIINDKNETIDGMMRLNQGQVGTKLRKLKDRMLKTVKPLRDELTHIKKKTEEEMEEVLRFMKSRIEDLVHKLSEQKEINISIKTDLSSEAAKLKKSNDENAALKGQVRHL